MRQRKQLDSVLLFGEGKTEQIFLQHICNLYRPKLKELSCKVDYGRGGAPKMAVTKMLKAQNLANYSRSLLLIDQDLAIDATLLRKLKSQEIVLSQSAPLCLEGMLLEILSVTPPKRYSKSSIQLKKYFKKKYATGSGSYTKQLSIFCAKKLTLKILSSRRSSCSSLDEILKFLEV